MGSRQGLQQTGAVGSGLKVGRADDTHTLVVFALKLGERSSVHPQNGEMHRRPKAGSETEFRGSAFILPSFADDAVHIDTFAIKDRSAAHSARNFCSEREARTGCRNGLRLQIVRKVLDDGTVRAVQDKLLVPENLAELVHLDFKVCHPGITDGVGHRADAYACSSHAGLNDGERLMRGTSAARWDFADGDIRSEFEVQPSDGQWVVALICQERCPLERKERKAGHLKERIVRNEHTKMEVATLQGKIELLRDFSVTALNRIGDNVCGSNQQSGATYEKAGSNATQYTFAPDVCDDGHDAFPENGLHCTGDRRAALHNNDVVVDGEEVCAILLWPLKVTAMHRGNCVDAVLSLFPKNLEKLQGNSVIPRPRSA